MSAIEFVHLAPDDYERAKAVFNAARHPGFIGRELVFRAAKQGQACIAVLDGADVGVGLVAKDKLLALSVAVTAQGRGIGPALMAHLKPGWVSAIMEKVPFFEKLGYAPVGAPKVGQNGKHATQLMQLLRPEALSPREPGAAVSAGTTPRQHVASQSQPAGPSLVDLIDRDLGPRKQAEFDILEGMFQAANIAGKFESALKIMEQAKRLIRN